MGLLDFLHRPPRPEIVELPLFPLQTVLFPGGLLSLKLFEQRYLDMAARCLKTQAPFGICLIARGKEVGEAAEPHPIGTLAEIASCEVPQLGIMQLAVRGGRRFRILDSTTGADNLLHAKVELFAPTPFTPLPANRERLLPLLRRVVDDLGGERIEAPYRFDDADWVGCRITEILPIQNLAKQKLMELEDPLTRLEILEKYLGQRGLLA